MDVAPRIVQLKSLLVRLSKRRLARFLVLWFAGFLVLQGFTLVALTKGANHLEFFPSELVLPLVMNVVTALLVAALAFAVPRPRYFGAKLVIVVVLTLLFVDYESRFQAVSGVLRVIMPPFFGDWNDLLLLSIVLLALLVAGALWLGRRAEGLQKKYPGHLSSYNLTFALFIFIAFVVGGGSMRILSMLPTVAGQAATTPAPIQLAPSQLMQDKPDIYYIVLDRYTNQQVLHEEFGYDNGAFTGFLDKRGFVVRSDATANYPFTDMSLASTLNAGYLNPYTQGRSADTIQSHALFHNLIQQSSVAQALKDKGYTYTHIGSWYNATSQSPLADVRYAKEWELHAFGKEKTLTSFEGQQIAKSPYYHFVKSRVFQKIAALQETNGVAFEDQQLHQLRDIAQSPDQGGRFVFAHLMTTHPPYYFNADGSYAVWPEADNVGKPVRMQYVDQIEYVNNELKRLVKAIQKNSDGNAVIVITSDEGPYPAELFPDESIPADQTAWSDEWLRMKYGILQAAYIPKATEQDWEHLTGVNLFRIIFNRYLEQDIEYLPACNLALTRGRDHQFIQTDITKRLTGEQPDFCKTVASGV